MDDDKLEAAASASKRLAGLLDDPHPGLQSWWIAVVRLKTELDEAMGCTTDGPH